LELIFQKKKGKSANCLAPPWPAISYSKVHYFIYYLYPVGNRIQLMAKSKWITFQVLEKHFEV